MKFKVMMKSGNDAKRGGVKFIVFSVSKKNGDILLALSSDIPNTPGVKVGRGMKELNDDK